MTPSRSAAQRMMRLFQVRASSSSGGSAGVKGELPTPASAKVGINKWMSSAPKVRHIDM